ncbi:T9SS type A sorting domain-containing protein [Flavobacterium wongokense]|uniref:T9SS type A sorting domain-containing protein n=1 Tax=Flavobacterium wongokense TaxID=2910674 RepID=UPI001F2A0FD0|nr:T9SS type A sorting domain-containing protein [Flavobacterium sp. WG47]MCF6133166.1 T9SS type A sorting domain-containing protein [Flavobacterium sp. WG47]
MKAKLLFVFAFLAFQISSAKIIVDPVAPTIQPLQYCDPNNDGFGEFDLTSATSLILAAQSGNASLYVVSYHETQADADTGTSPLSSPYTNINPWSQIVYYRIRNTNTNAVATGQLKLNVNPKPEATTPVDYHLCDVNGPTTAELFDLTTVIPQVLGAINPSTATVSFHHSQLDAQDDFSPLPTLYWNVTPWNEVLYVRVEINATGCYDVVPMHLVVDPLPQALQPNYPPYSLCDFSAPTGMESFDLTSQINSILMGQTGMSVTFYPSLAAAQNGTNPITNPSSYTNTIIYVQTLGIRITNNVTGCYTVSTMDIRVEPLPQLIAPSAPYAICDSNQDGIGQFDLTSLIPDLTQGGNYTVTFHETLMDAEVNGTTIPSPSNYLNIYPFVQTIYVRAEDNITHCVSILPIQIQVNPSPIAAMVAPISVCDNDANPQNGATLFDLTVMTPDILAQQPSPASNYMVSYYTNQASALTGTPVIAPATAYVGHNGDTIWFRVELNTTHCFAIGSFSLAVTSPPLLTTPTPLQVCDSDANPNDHFAHFDLTVKNTEITQGHPDYTVVYYPSLINAQTGTNAIADPTSYVNSVATVQTLGVVVYGAAPMGCQSITTLDIRVMPIPTPNTNPPALVPKCDVNNPGDLMEVFDLTLNVAYIANGDPTLTFHFFESIVEAENNVNEILTPTAAVVGGNVWIRVDNIPIDFQGNHCYVLVEQPLRVNPLPNPIITSDDSSNTVYVDAGNSAVVRPLLLDSSVTGNYSYEWYEGANVVGTGATYLVDTASPGNASRFYTVYVENNVTGCYNTSSLFTVLQSNGVPAPIGMTNQSLTAGSTLANIIVTGSNIQWYASASNKTNLTTNAVPLPLNTVLVEGATYYATQTVGGIESASRLPVTVHLTLGTGDNEILPIRFAPNPVKDILTLQSTVVIKSVSVYTILGQKVFEQDYDDTNINVDLSRLATGNYILKAQGEIGQKTIRIIKE